MTTFRPDTSFPYLKIAREFGVDYGRVIRFGAELDVVPPSKSDWGILNQWELAVCIAWLHERDRRDRVKAEQGLIVASVVGNCGTPHTFEEWRACRACDTPKPIKPETFAC